MNANKQPNQELLTQELLSGLYDSCEVLTPNSLGGKDECVGPWYKGKLSFECIPESAFDGNQSFIKILKEQEKVFMYTAIPTIIDNEKKIIQFTKDITHVGVAQLSDTQIGYIKDVFKNFQNIIERDPLTDSYKATVSFSKLQTTIDKALINKQPLSLVFVSVNHITELNQAFGNVAGNYMLKQVARLLLGYCSHPDDFISRVHGLRYFLVLNNTSKKKAYSICKDLNKKALKSKVIFEQQSLKMSLNIGFHTMEKQWINADQFYKNAQGNVFINHTLSEETLVQKSKDEFVQIKILSLRENEVAELLINGLSNQDIAQQLFISESTVKKHIASIYQKLHIKSRAEFIAQYNKKAI